MHKDAKHQLEIDVTDSVEVLRFQVFSLTDVPPDEQQITGIGPGILRDDAELKNLGIAPGTWAMLIRKPAAAANPPPAPAMAAPVRLARNRPGARASLPCAATQAVAAWCPKWTWWGPVSEVLRCRIRTNRTHA